MCEPYTEKHCAPLSDRPWAGGVKRTVSQFTQDWSPEESSLMGDRGRLMLCREDQWLQGPGT